MIIDGSPFKLSYLPVPVPDVYVQRCFGTSGSVMRRNARFRVPHAQLDAIGDPLASLSSSRAIKIVKTT